MYFKYDMRVDFQTAEIIKTEKLEQSIQIAKKMDLLSLCKSGMILKEFHEYYKTLPSNSSVVD
ncbi:hypothetical protein MAR_007040 [Mya arenaria]|uniref:Uncharacterized protein n=1 Tax=Mya arenaria TaxID=6604 RepID=A0ABY7DB71_MYAAR|nr:hypothetical protein MAR_007040 [Mya arenaria]